MNKEEAQKQKQKMEKRHPDNNWMMYRVPTRDEYWVVMTCANCVN